MRGAIRLPRHHRSAAGRATPAAGTTIGSPAPRGGRRAVWRRASPRAAGAARPLGGQAHGAAVALEQAAPDRALQALDRARQRRRADVAFAASLQEAQRAREVQEKPERVVIHAPVDGMARVAEIATVI